MIFGDVITNWCLYFNGGLNQQPVLLEHGWVTISQCFKWNTDVITYPCSNQEAGLICISKREPCYLHHFIIVVLGPEGPISEFSLTWRDKRRPRFYVSWMFVGHGNPGVEFQKCSYITFSPINRNKTDAFFVKNFWHLFSRVGPLESKLTQYFRQIMFACHQQHQILYRKQNWLVYLRYLQYCEQNHMTHTVKNNKILG